MRPARLLLWLAILVAATLAGNPAHAADRWLTTSDGVRLHMIVEGSPAAPPILFVPGWAMPGWIWKEQLDAFSKHFRTVALDPRGQGSSEIPDAGYTHQRRAQDIAEVVHALGPRRVLLVGWSLGVLDELAYVHEYGDGALAGLVLVDNSVGEPPPPRITAAPPRARTEVECEEQTRRFVASMFHRDPGPAYLDALTAAALRLPPGPAAALLAYPVPRSFWREAVLSVRKPVLYVVRPRLAAQAANLAEDSPTAETRVFADAGHALFIDDAARFDAVLADFIERRVRW